MTTRLIHNADGSLVPDRPPHKIVGKKFRSKRSGNIGIVTEECLSIYESPRHESIERIFRKSISTEDIVWLRWDAYGSGSFWISKEDIEEIK